MNNTRRKQRGGTKKNMETNNKIPTPKVLQGKQDFRRWKAEMQLFLTYQDLLLVAQGSETPPVAPSDTQGDSREFQEYLKQKKHFEKRDAKAK